jgi:hypothetical protein
MEQKLVPIKNGMSLSITKDYLIGKIPSLDRLPYAPAF